VHHCHCLDSFPLFCLARLSAEFTRLRAAITASPPLTCRREDYKSRAISLVLAGGIIGGILGPESSKVTKELLSVTFMGSYAVLALSG
jgi:hypothetical protein